MTEFTSSPPLDGDNQLTDATERRLRDMAAEVIAQHAERAGLANAPSDQVYRRFGATVQVAGQDDEIFRMVLVITDAETGQMTRYELSEDGDLVEFPEAQGTA